MAFVSGFLSDLSGVKDNITLRVRILRAWMQPVFMKPHILNMEMIVMDEHNSRMQAQVRSDKLHQFKQHLKEGNTLQLQRYTLQEIQPKWQVVKNPFRISFLTNTEVETCVDFNGPRHGFAWRPYKTITDLEQEEDGQFDVVGQVIACDDLDNFEKKGKAGKKKPLTLLDDQGNELGCTLWDDFAQQFNDFLKSCEEHGKIILVLQLCRMKKWDGKMIVQNAFNATKLFLFNGNKAISEDEFGEVEEFRQRLFANQPNEQSESTSTKISTASKNSTRDTFLTKYPIRNIAELLDVEQGVVSVMVGTVLAIIEDEGWYYIGCRGCSTKVIKSIDYIDLESEMPKKPNGPNDWWCKKCNAWVSHPRTVFRLQIRVQDHTGTISLSLFNDEVQVLAKRSAYKLCEKYTKMESDGSFPTEITSLVGQKYAFMVSIDDYNVKKLLKVFTVLKLSTDLDIINSVLACATPVKEHEASSKELATITPLDLESQSDENATPTNTQNDAATSTIEKGNPSKRPAEDEPGCESSTGKKKAVEVKVEKNP